MSKGTPISDRSAVFKPFPGKPFSFSLPVPDGRLDRRIALYTAGPSRADEPPDEAWLYWDADML